MPTWTDYPASSNTHIRAVQLSELRSVVNGYLQAAALPPYTWTDGSGPYNDTLSSTNYIRAIHFTELAAQIQNLWSNGLHGNLGSLPAWSAGSPPSSARQISARDVNDLRNWVNFYDGDPVIPYQGIVDYSYDPDVPAAVGADWCSDLSTNLFPTSKIQSGPLNVRTLVKNGAPNAGAFVSAFNVWRGVGVADIGLVLTGEFFNNGVCPNCPFPSGSVWDNGYIQAYADSVQNFLSVALAAG